MVFSQLAVNTIWVLFSLKVEVICSICVHINTSRLICKNQKMIIIIISWKYPMYHFLPCDFCWLVLSLCLSNSLNFLPTHSKINGPDMCSKGLLTLGYEGTIICWGGEIVTEGFFIKKIKVLLFLNFFCRQDPKVSFRIIVAINSWKLNRGKRKKRKWKSWLKSFQFLARVV